MSMWPMVPLGEVLTQYKEYIDAPEAETYPKLSVKLYGRGVELDNPTDGTSLKMKRHQLAKSGQVILSEIWGKKGAIGIVPSTGEGALCTSHFFLFDINASKLLHRWLAYVFKANYLAEQLDSNAKGTTGYAAVRPAHLLKAIIPLPSLAEQQRLIERIDALARKIEEAKRLRELVQREQRALATSAISSQLNALDFCGKLSDVLLSTPRNGWSAQCDGLDTGTQILSLGAITGFWYRPDQFKWTSEATNPNAHYWLKPGDLLISRSNTPDLVGHATIYNGVPAPCIYPDLLMLLQPDTARYDQRFIHYVLQSNVVRGFIRTHAKGTSPTMKKISQGTVMAIPFPTKCPKEQQVVIADRLDFLRTKLQDATNKQTATAKELDAMLPAILDQAFRGER